MSEIMSPTVKILDGGLGTSLEDRYGVVFDHSRPLWSSHLLVSDPDTLAACQRDFVAAGADVLLTATYQVSIAGFAGTRTPEHPNGIDAAAARPFLRRALDIAEEACGGSDSAAAAEVALSCGPYGASMVPGQEYTGAYDAAHAGAEDLAAWHVERLRLYGEEPGLPARVRYVAFETVPRLEEVWAVRSAFARLGGGFPDRFWICCVFPGEGEGLPDGSSVRDAVNAMLADPVGGEPLPRPWGIGINCTKIHKLDGLIRRFEEAVTALREKGVVEETPALVLYPDGTNGEVYNTSTKQWEMPAGKETDSSATRIPWETNLAGIVESAKQRGVFTSFLVGGCCKANHEDIKRLREQLTV